MLLPPHELELFFRLHQALMFFVNERLKVTPDKVASPEEFASSLTRRSLGVYSGPSQTFNFKRLACPFNQPDGVH